MSDASAIKARFRRDIESSSAQEDALSGYSASFKTFHSSFHSSVSSFGSSVVSLGNDIGKVATQPFEALAQAFTASEGSPDKSMSSTQQQADNSSREASASAVPGQFSTRPTMARACSGRRMSFREAKAQRTIRGSHNPWGVLSDSDESGTGAPSAYSSEEETMSKRSLESDESRPSSRESRESVRIASRPFVPAVSDDEAEPSLTRTSSKKKDKENKPLARQRELGSRVIQVRTTSLSSTSSSSISSRRNSSSQNLLGLDEEGFLLNPGSSAPSSKEGSSKDSSNTQILARKNSSKAILTDTARNHPSRAALSGRIKMIVVEEADLLAKPRRSRMS